MPTPHTPSLSARRAIRQVGVDLRNARLRRRLPMDVVAERASISRQTLGRIERGDHAVSIGAVAAVMHALGLASLLERVLAADPVGEAIETENLPRRIRIRREPKAEP